MMPGKRVQFDDGRGFQELTNETFADLLHVHGRPIDLGEMRTHGTVIRLCFCRTRKLTVLARIFSALPADGADPIGQP
jgi:hypothetical protein